MGVENAFLSSVVQNSLEQQNISVKSVLKSNTLLHFARLHPQLIVHKSKAVGHQYTIAVRDDASTAHLHIALVKACKESIEHLANGTGKAYVWTHDLERWVDKQWSDVCYYCDCAKTSAMFKVWLFNHDKVFWLGVHKDRGAVVGVRKGA